MKTKNKSDKKITEIRESGGKSIRARLGITQEKIAELISCSRSSVSSWELGDRNMPILAARFYLDLLEKYNRKMKING